MNIFHRWSEILRSSFWNRRVVPDLKECLHSFMLVTKGTPPHKNCSFLKGVARIQTRVKMKSSPYCFPVAVQLGHCVQLNVHVVQLQCTTETVFFINVHIIDSVSLCV